MSLRPSRTVFLSLALALAGSPAHADALYNATPLSSPGYFQPIAEGLSNSGEALFWNPMAPVRTPTYFLYNAQTDGTITSLDSSGGPSTPKYDPHLLGGNGQILGGLGSQPVLTVNGQNTVIPGWGQAVSDNGQVAFQIGQSSFIYNNGVSTSLGNVSGYETTYVQGVNDSGQAAATGGHVVIGDKGSRSEPLFFNGHFVAGGSGFLSQPLFFNGHTLVPLGTFGGPNGNAIAINNKGDITGEAMNASGDYVGFVSHNGGPLISLGTLPGGVPVSPRSINDSGQIVGYNGSPGLGAFLYQNGVLTNLNALLSPSASNINLVDAYFINNVGQILAKGIVKNPPSAQAQLFLLTPVGMPLPPRPTR